MTAKEPRRFYAFDVVFTAALGFGVALIAALLLLERWVFR